MKSKLTKEEELLIIEYYLLPETLSATANHFCRKNNTIKKVLLKYNIKLHTSEEIIQIQQIKRILTCNKKYGVDHFTKTNKFKQFMQDSYEQNRQKTIVTCQEKYGVDNPMQNKEVQERSKLTNIKKYGVENVFQTEKVKAKIKQTNIDRYGVEHVLQAEKFKVKANQTKIKRYGRTDIGQFGTVEHNKAMYNTYGSIHFNGNSCYRIDNIYFDSLPELALYL